MNNVLSKLLLSDFMLLMCAHRDRTNRPEALLKPLATSHPVEHDSHTVAAFVPAGLVIGFSMTPPILDRSDSDLVIPVNETLTLTCRYVWGQLWVGSAFMQLVISGTNEKYNSGFVFHINDTRCPQRFNTSVKMSQSYTVLHTTHYNSARNARLESLTAETFDL